MGAFVRSLLISSCFLIPGLAAFGQCPLSQDPVDASIASPTIASPTPGDVFVRGTALDVSGKVMSGTIAVCVDAVAAPAVSVQADGSFVAASGAIAAGQSITAQFLPAAGGHPSTISTLKVPTLPAAPPSGCASHLNAGSPSTITMTRWAGGSFVGSVPAAKHGFVEICVNDQPLAALSAVQVSNEGTFAGAGLSVSAKDTVTVFYAAAAGANFTNASSPVLIIPDGQIVSPVTSVGPLSLSHMRLMGGIDVAASASTDPAAKFLLEGDFEIPIAPGGGAATVDSFAWISALVRLASIAQPGAVSSISNPAAYVGTMTDNSPSQLVQSGEAYFYQEFNLAKCTSCASRPSVQTFHLIAGGGVITPLSPSQVSPTIYTVTQQLYSYYVGPPAQNGSTAITTACGTSYSTTTPCYVAYVPQGRTRFYREWETGFRFRSYLQNQDPKDGYMYPSSASITFGQNEYVTGGSMHGFVLHAGGVFAIPASVASSLAGMLYVYGAVDLNLNGKNQNSQQFVLATAPSTVSATSSAVAELNVASQTRDRYRFGVALDLQKLVGLLGKPK